MKNFRKFAISRTSIISIIVIAIILFSISSIDERKKHVVFEIVESNVTISGTGNLNEWKMEASSITCFGDFESNEHELLTISGLGFLLPINMLKSDNQQLESAVADIFKKSGCDQLIFKQQYSMILPVMKKIHVIGELNMLNGKYTLPLQVSYELKDNQTLRIKGRQTISLSQYGVKIPPYLVGIIDDDVELEVDFLLVNKNI